MRHTYKLRRGASALVLLLLVLAVAVRGKAQVSTQGQWSAVANWPTRAIHATLLPDGRVFFVSYYAESLRPSIWDPVTNTFTSAAASSFALFCGGHTTLADGRVFLAGGHVADYVGYPHAVIYDAAANTFTSLPDMNAARWYPTVTTLPNGDVLVVSGDINSNTNVDPLPQVFQFSTRTWRNLTTAQMALPLYPNMLPAPNGKVFNAGPGRQTRYLDTAGTGAWSNVALQNFTGFRDYGPVVMYAAGKVLAVGGADPPTNTAEVIDLNAAVPAWKYTGSMHFPRRQHNAVILPDGRVFIVGGSSAGGFDTSTSPVMPAEMWDPATGQFTVMAGISAYRGYHSVALLLPDGRVLSAGGNVGGPNAQVFSPPYLFAGPRPTIQSAPVAAGYGQTVLIATPDAGSVAKVTLLREASVTHTNSMSQGFLSLSFTQTAAGVSVSMPANANLAPPGYYMLFILNGAGVPSIGRILRISSTATALGTITGNVTNPAGAPISGAMVSSGGSRAVTGAIGGYTLQLPAGTVTLTASLAGYQDASESTEVVAGTGSQAYTLQIQPLSPGGITGTVADSDGKALSDATVSAAGLSAQTDENGNYALNNLPAGSAAVSASLSGFQTATATVDVVADVVTPAPAITLISGSGTVTGKVAEVASGNGISAASVSYGGGTTSTDDQGNYTIAEIPVGTIQLVASAAGFQSLTQNVTVSGGAVTTSNFNLAAAAAFGTVTGKITSASTGAIVPGATVSWGGGSVTADAGGVYTLTHVAGGSQNITAVSTGYLSRTLTVGVMAGATATLNIPIATAGKIAVKVLAANGTPVSGASLTIKGGCIPTTVTGTTGSTGTFTTNWIPVGAWTVTVTKTGHATQTKNSTVVSGATASVTFSAF